MPFRKNKKEGKIIQCSICEWNPDGEEYWACSCGHKWNTFKTKGKCPYCKTQWENTWCPGCGKSTPHEDWYKTSEEIRDIENSGNLELKKRKWRLESRLIDYGIMNYRVSHLEYLDHSNVEFQSTYDSACRMIILYSIGYSVHNLDERPQIIDWLKNENIWVKVSQSEKEFFFDVKPDEIVLMNLSWRIESALTLGWCLSIVNTLPRLDDDDNDIEIEEFQKNIPEIGDPLADFFFKLTYRDKDDIYEECMLNELATAYFRDLMFNGQEDETKINRNTSFERHQVLNWLRKFMEIEEWDETDTST